METNEQKTARLLAELETAAAALAVAEELVARHGAMLDRSILGAQATATAREQWRQLKTIGYMASARFELALQRWLAAQL